MSFKRLISKGLRVLLQPPAVTDSSVNKKAKICSGSQINKAKIARYTYIGHDCFVVNANIGSFCSIADNCRIGGASHRIDYVSSSPVFNKGRNVLKTNFASCNGADTQITIIESDVWIGANAIIKSGITIGVGSVVGAGSVVTHDIPPYEIWAGNPAKKIRDRFDNKLKASLMETKWWEFDENKLKIYSSYFNDPEQFINVFNKSKKK